MNDEVVKLLEPLIGKWPWWLLPSLVVLGTLCFCVQQVFSLVNTISETKRNTAETKLREEGLAVLKKKETPSKTSAAPKYEPVALTIWLLSSRLTILNTFVFVSVVTSETVTTSKVALTALSILGAAWSFATPVSSNLIRILIYSLREHAWIAETTLGHMFG
jgi:hypothetical protein